MDSIGSERSGATEARIAHHYTGRITGSARTARLESVLFATSRAQPCAHRAAMGQRRRGVQLALRKRPRALVEQWERLGIMCAC